MDNTLVMFWNELAAKTMNVHTNPGRDARRFAMVQIAIHNALNTIEEKYKRYAFYHPFDGTASAAAAINTAAKDMLLWALGELLPNSAVTVFPQDIYNHYHTKMASLNYDDALARGMAIGEKAAQAIIDLRQNDGAVVYTGAGAKPDGINQRQFRADYYNAPPAPNNKLMINYGKVPPFVLNNNIQFRQKEDNSAQAISKYNQAYTEVMTKGSLENALASPPSITPLEKTKTEYWSDLRQHVLLNDFVDKVSATQNLDAWQTARLLALIHTAMADGAICMFEDLYQFYHWRPITAINNALNGHPIQNNKWKPFKDTPRVPENPSLFAIASGATGFILKKMVGKDNIPTVTLSNGLQTLTYNNIKKAMEDNAETKIYCGWNFRTTVEKSLKQGQDIGKYVFDNAFQPAT